MIFCRFDQARGKIITDFVESNLVGKKVLELGCCSGDRTKLFYDLSEVIGVDLKHKVLIERKYKFAFFLADATELPFKNESFDAVVSFDVIEHITDDKRFVSEAFRVCKRGGYVVLGTPNRLRLSNRLMALIGKKITYPYYLGPDTIHVREYTKEQFVSLCENAGLVGGCACIWVGLVDRINKGLEVFPPFAASVAQYLLFISHKP